MLKINGKDEVHTLVKTVSEYIKSADYKQSALAVELNNEILSKKAYDTTVLKDNDVLEIVCFMGGADMLIKLNGKKL